jgi:hypothetical protein
MNELLGETKAFRQAEAIRAYVSAVLDRRNGDPSTLDKEINLWADWALRRADIIDPLTKELGWVGSNSNCVRQLLFLRKALLK